MKQKIVTLTLFAALTCQSFAAAESQRAKLKEEVETLLSDLDSAKSSLEKNLIRKNFLKSNLGFLAQQIEKQIKKLEKKLEKCAKKLQEAKDSEQAKSIKEEMKSLKEKIKKLKDSLLGDS